MNSPLVSILIPAYNAAPWIDASIRSALAQTWGNKEIIVVDDGSSDDTMAIAAAYRQQGVTVLTQRNAGASAARNAAFAASSGAFIQYLDADDLLAPDKIARQMELLATAPPGTLSSSAWAMFVDDPSSAHFKPNPLGADFVHPEEWLITAWSTGAWMQPTAWLTPRAVIERAGPWDESLSLHDDGEFFSRVVLQSCGIRFCAEAKSYYRKGIGSSLSSVRSDRAVDSHFRICALYEAHLLSRTDAPAARAACSVNYQRFVYEYYPEYPELRRAAAAAAKRLSDVQIPADGSPAFRKMARLVGWKLARRIEKWLYRNRLNPEALRRRLFHS